MTLDEAIELVTRKWSSNGECASCGWHAALYEYGGLTDTIHINTVRQRVELPCLSDDEERSSHRGVRIPFDATTSGPAS